MTKKIRTYSAEFKAEAVKKIAGNNGNISATAKLTPAVKSVQLNLGDFSYAA